MRYTDTAPKSRRFLRDGFALKKFGGLVTGIGQSNVPDDAAVAMRDFEREDGSLSTRRGYRNVIAPQTNWTTVKGFHWCQTYSAEVLYEALLVFGYDGSNLRPYEVNYDLSSDSWGYHEITQGAGHTNLDNTYWRRVCFQDKVYYFNTNDSNPVWEYTIGSYTSAKPVAPPASPSSPPGISYYLNTSSGFTYSRYWGAQGSYAASDVTEDATVFTADAMSGEQVKVTVSAAGQGTVTLNLLHGGGSVDMSYNDVFVFAVTVNDTTKADIDLANLKFTLNGAGSQALDVSVAAKDFDSKGYLKRVTYYVRFNGKTRSAWTACTTVTLTLQVNSITGGPDYIFVTPLTAGGIVDWGGDFAFVSQLSYSYYDTTTLYESGLSPALTLDRARLLGTLVNGSPDFPLGSIPVVTNAATGSADKMRLYGRVRVDQGTQVKRPDVFTAWRRIVEQNDATGTYSYAVLPNDFQGYTEYAPATFDYTGVVAAYVSNNHVVWLYSGGAKNVRRSRDGVAVAQASTDDAFKTSVSQDDVLRGSNHSLVGDFQDEPVGGMALPGADVILGKNRVYISFDTGDGLPSGFTHPEPVAGAPGCMGPHAFCRFHDADGQPIVVYLAPDGETLWAVRVPRGYTPGQPITQAAWEYGSLVRDGFDTYLFGGSSSRDAEAVSVYADPVDDTVHLRYNQRELKLGRPDVVDGRRHWEPVYFGTGQWGSTWQKVVQFRSSAVKYGIFGLRLNGAIDEFYRASLKHPTSGDRILRDLTGASMTPVSCTATVVTFDVPPEWASGTGMHVQTAAHGLSTVTTYYFGRLTYLTYSLYDTQANAQAAGVTGRINLSNSGPWLAGAVTPLGRDDGAAMEAAPYWQGKFTLADRRRPRRVHVQKTDVTDSFVVTAYNEEGDSSSVTIGDGFYHAAFPVGLSGFELSYKVTGAEGNSAIDGIWTEETILSQRRGRA